MKRSQIILAAAIIAWAVVVVAWSSTALAAVKPSCKAPAKAQPVMVKKRVRRHHRWVVVKRHGKAVMVKQRKHGRVVTRCVKPKAKAKPTAAKPDVKPQAASASSSRAPSLPTTEVATGFWSNDCTTGQGGVRIILPYYSDPSRFLGCAQEAVKAGRKLLVSIEYANCWTLAHDAARFRAALAVYAPLHPYSISIGNEQELPTEDGCSTDVPSDAGKAAAYAKVWKAVEPLVAQSAPSAIRVAFEASPWGTAFARDAAADGLPGAQAFSIHAYPSGNTNDLPVFVKLAQSYGVQPMATEGLCGPGAWTEYGCRTMAQLHGLGFALAAEWVS